MEDGEDGWGGWDGSMLGQHATMHGANSTGGVTTQRAACPRVAHSVLERRVSVSIEQTGHGSFPSIECGDVQWRVICERIDKIGWRPPLGEHLNVFIPHMQAGFVEHARRILPIVDIFEGRGNLLRPRGLQLCLCWHGWSWRHCK